VYLHVRICRCNRNRQEISGWASPSFTQTLTVRFPLFTLTLDIVSATSGSRNVTEILLQALWCLLQQQDDSLMSFTNEGWRDLGDTEKQLRSHGAFVPVLSLRLATTALTAAADFLKVLSLHCLFQWWRRKSHGWTN